MTLDELLAALCYKGSPHFLRRGDGRFESEPGYGHIFRRGEDKAEDESKKRWQVEGVYGLRDSDSTPERFVPIVYVCKAADEHAALELHRLVWNQDVVPYVIVHDPKGVRVYAGFQFSKKGKSDSDRGVLQTLTDWDQVQSIIDLFNAKAVDEGKIWQNQRLQVDPSRRVYHQLLKDLRELDKWLRGPGGLKKEVSHALIGKYVYLHYLRDRKILSDDRLTGMWGIQESEIFKGTATKAALEKLSEKLEDWLNGEIFPLSFSGPNAPSSDHVKRVAATFAGDKIRGETWQPHFDFKAYDFSYIPIETLSLIYEQFLHAEDDDAKKVKKKKTKGRKAGAYYTPLPLVNYMLAELQGRHPLKEGMKVCDPSCGSGAFLVQAYRRLIETTYPMDGRPRPKPTDMRRLLQTSIFGVDLDGDACQVTQLSLLLTLLDYVNPPDLTGRNSNFKLPSLLNPKEGHKPNLFEGNFFEVEPKLRAAAGEVGFDWIVGNPPWKQLKNEKHDGHDQPVWDWMKTNATKSPVGMHQVAQAFAWEAPRYLASDGECALLVPAMGLFEEPSEGFREKFFFHFQVHTVANFANLAEVLFDGRSRVPAASLFYRLRSEGKVADSDEPVTIYSPFVVNQEATRPLASGERRKLWSLVVNCSEVRTVDFGEIAGGSGLPWKLAMWGTPWDERLVRRLEQKWDSLGQIEDRAVIFAAQGPDLYPQPKLYSELEEGEELQKNEEKQEGQDEKPRFEKHPELLDKRVLDVKKLKKLRDIFLLPATATVLNKKTFIRLQGGKEGIRVFEPPHILVSAARNFAIYSDEFTIVPARQIGIISTAKDTVFLKALALFLSSDFAYYHQFIRATELGVKRDRATIESLRKLPLPIAKLSRSELKEWVSLHTKLASCFPRPLHHLKKKDAKQSKFEFAEEVQTEMQPMLDKLNDMTAQVLGLDGREKALVHDLVRVRFQLNDGKRGIEAMRPPENPELRSYARRLKEELDDFVGDDSDRLHRVTVVYDDDSAMVEVDFTRDHGAARKVELLRASSEEAKRLRATRQKLLEERAQWVYFNRNLRLYRGHQTYLFKPLQRFHWTESAAMTDASDLIAETLGGPQ